MLVGEVITLAPSAAPVALSPANSQVQLSSVTVRLPEAAPAGPASSRAGSKRSSSAPPRPRTNEVLLFTHAIIGSGSFGIVYRASCHRFPSLALKVCFGKPNRLQKEWAALSKCAAVAAGGSGGGGSGGAKKGSATSTSSASHIPEVYFAAWSSSDPSLLVIGMELCVPLTLHDLLVCGPSPLGVGTFLAREVAEAVAFVHRCGCIHRDVKLQNFVFSLEGRLRLIDFGIATDTLDPPPGDVTAGTLAFMAPEMAANVLRPKADRVSVGAPADVWALGIILFCIFTQSDLYTDVADDPKTPGADDFNTRLLHRVARGEWRWPAGSEQAVPAGFRDLIERCLQLDPAARPSMAEVMGMPCWLGGVAPPRKGAALPPVAIPEEVRAFLAVESYGVDERGAVRVEGASVRRSPSGHLLGLGATPTGAQHLPIPSARADGGASSSSLVDDLLSPLQGLGSGGVGGAESGAGPSGGVVNGVAVSRALLTETSPTGPRPPPPLPAATPTPARQVTMPFPGALPPMTPSAFNADDALLGLFSPPTAPPAASHWLGSSGLSLTPSTVAPAPEPPAAVSPQKPKVAVSAALLRQKLPKAQHQQITREEREARDAVVAERDVAMADLASLFRCQSDNYKHPHRFRFHERPMNKSYREGYVCDTCGDFFVPYKGLMPFYHCSCGSDLCEPCFAAYKATCACDNCGAVLENPQSLQRHKIKCDARPAPQRSRRGSTSLAPSRKRERSQPLAGAVGLGSDTTIRQLPRGAGSSSRPRAGGRQGSAGTAAGDYCLPTVPASHEPLVTEPVSLNPISPLAPPGQWSPFEGCRQRAAAEVAAALAMMPTEDERQHIVGDVADWVRYFHYYPEGAGAEALVYSVQPGRTGSIFLSNTSSIHSAVVAIVESRILVVDYVDAQTGRDRVRTMSLEEGKQQQPTSVDILLNVVQRDTNLLKQRRAVGTMSQYQRQQTGIGCFGQPFIYVRWVRRDLANRIDVFCLSNGSFQVFIQDSYEIRWMDGGRKFRVRSNGVCELVDEAAFAAIPALVELTGPM